LKRCIKAFALCLAFQRGAQEAEMAGFLDHEDVFERVAFLLATGEFVLVLGSSGAVDGSLRAIMPNRGGQRETRRSFGGKHHYSRIGVANWTQLLISQCPIEHYMEEMNPHIRMGLGHPKEF
jgi:hypothetical protein